MTGTPHRPLHELIAAFVRNPDSPEGLQLQSQINRSMRPLAEARAQAIEACLAKLRGEGQHDQAQAAVDAAHAHLARVLGMKSLPPDIVKEVEEQAGSIAKRARPPAIETIVPAALGISDVGYKEGLHLNGVRGAWHRLWAMMILHAQIGADDEECQAAEKVVREQLEQALGFAVSGQQLEELRKDALQQARRMPPVG